MTIDDSPRYRIQAVSDMTSIPAPTLRAWERRYGVPTPGRTGKGYRLYSPRDVELVTRMRDLCDSGMSASDAARMVSEPSSGRDQEETPPGDPHQVVTQRIVDAVVAFDADRLDRELRVAQTMGAASSIFELIFAPAMREVGDRWHAGTLSVAQEHLASEALARSSRLLLALVQPTTAPRTAILACWEDEQHVLPLYGIAFRMAQWGYRCVMLGACTPADALATAVGQVDPDLVGLSLTLSPPPAALETQARAYVEAAGDAHLVVGGVGAVDNAALLEDAGLDVHRGDLEALRRGLSRAP